MATFKYIIVTANAFKGGQAKAIHIPLIFGHFFAHGDIAEMARGLARQGQFRLSDIKVYSAGMVDMGEGNGFICHGESETLGIKPMPGDAKLIENFRMDWDWDFGR